MAIVGLHQWKLALYVVPFAIIPAIQVAQELITTDFYSWSTRLEAWIIVLEIVKINPVIGIGMANYRWYTPLFPIRGYDVFFVSHSQYIDLIAQTGIIGILCFFYVFFRVTQLAWRLRTKVGNGFAYGYVYGAIGGLAGTIVAGFLGDWIIPFFYNIGMKGFRASMLVWLFAGGLVVIEKYYIEPSPKQKDSSGLTEYNGVNN
ncbi:O-antigen ligase family protein [Chloroflexi bacterium TSY]|nr:O-antigen ligase family protein [Chloroflexi bacterium TSY]